MFLVCFGGEGQRDHSNDDNYSGMLCWHGITGDLSVLLLRNANQYNSVFLHLCGRQNNTQWCSQLIETKDDTSKAKQRS